MEGGNARWGAESASGAPERVKVSLVTPLPLGEAARRAGEGCRVEGIAPALTPTLSRGEREMVTPLPSGE